MRKGFLLLATGGLLVLAVAVVLLLTHSTPAEAELDPGIVGGTLQGALPQGDEPKTLDDLFETLARDIPGFGGMFYDEAGNLNVYLLDTSQRALAQTAISSVIGAQRVPKTGVRALPGRYGFSDLKSWHDRMLSLLEIPGVVFTDVDEKGNRLSVGVENAEMVSAVEQELERLGIPRPAVAIEETEPIVFAATLRDWNRPLQGGLQIAFSTYLCTLSFNAMRADAAGFVTNSHCTSTQGGVEGTVYHQPTIVDGVNRIGVETVDPDYFAGGACPVDKVCRYSDSAFAQRDIGVAAGLGLLERTTGLGAITIAGNYWIVGTVDWPLGGEVLNKVGRTTGWSQGNVTGTCMNFAVAATNIVMLCQDRVAATVDSGDSGSPVFSITDSPAVNDVELYGILWGKNTDGTEIVFSSIGQVQWESELGPLIVQQGVGGVQALPDAATDADSSDPLLYAAVAGAGLAAVVAIMGSGWYARRRWLR
jgi:hypothetical protein